MLIYLAAGFFLPLFPFSIVFNRLFARLSDIRLRTLLLLVWPQLGVALLAASDAPAPQWLMAWAVGSAVFYAFRSLTLREVGLWIGFLATSVWGVLWIPATASLEAFPVTHWYALGFSVPLVLLALLAHGLERRFGAAFTGLFGGLAATMPRFSVFVVLAVLAIIATPLFPGFFAILGSIVVASPMIKLSLVFVWLLWSWTGARLLQGLLVGPTGSVRAPDLNRATSLAYAFAFGTLAIGGTYLTGAL